MQLACRLRGIRQRRLALENPVNQLLRPAQVLEARLALTSLTFGRSDTVPQ